MSIYGENCPVWKQRKVVDAKEKEIERLTNDIRYIQDELKNTNVNMMWLEYEERKDSVEYEMLRNYHGYLNRCLKDSTKFLSRIIGKF